MLIKHGLAGLLTPSGFFDDFNRADESLQTSADYSINYGALRVASNRVEATDPSTDKESSYFIDASDAAIADFTWDMDCIFDTTAAGSIIAPGIRRNGSGHFIEITLGADGALNISLYNPSYSDLGAGGTTVTLNSTGVANTLRVVASGTAIDCYVNQTTTPDLSGTESSLQSETGKTFRLENSSTASASAQDTYADRIKIL